MIREHEEEPVLGIPEKLPQGERLLWQGSPDLLQFLLHSLHARKVALWFLIIAVWRTVSNYQLTGVIDLQLLGPLGFAFVLAMALLGLLALLLTRSTVYSMTNRRIIMRFGLAVPLTLNLPLSQILSASTREFKHDNGNIALSITPDKRLSYWVLWPHVRPFHWLQCQPTLKNIANVTQVAHTLRDLVIGNSMAQTPRRAAGQIDLSHDEAFCDVKLPQGEAQ